MPKMNSPLQLVRAAFGVGCSLPPRGQMAGGWGAGPAGGPCPVKTGLVQAHGFLGTLYPPPQPRDATAPKILSELGLEVLQLAERAVDRADD